MERTPDAIAHEEGLALFVSPARRPRFRDSLLNDRQRKKLRRALDHFTDLDVRFASEVATDEPDAIVKMLTAKGTSPCHVLSAADLAMTRLRS